MGAPTALLSKLMRHWNSGQILRGKWYSYLRRLRGLLSSFVNAIRYTKATNFDLAST